MLFIETRIFTTDVLRLLDPDDYRKLQTALFLRPAHGPLIEGSGGLRKIRWGQPGRGKRGGVRIIYYWDRRTDSIFMLMIYAKSAVDDLTVQQLRTLRSVVEEWLGDG